MGHTADGNGSLHSVLFCFGVGLTAFCTKTVNAITCNYFCEHLFLIVTCMTNHNIQTCCQYVRILYVAHTDDPILIVQACCDAESSGTQISAASKS